MISSFDERVNKVEKLMSFRERHKFSDFAWRERGLNPSSSDVSNTLQALFDEFATDLIEAINQNGSQRQLRTYLVAALDRFDKDSLDTEEKDVVADLVFELSTIIGVDIKMKLNSWLYGPILALLLKIGTVISKLKGPYPTVVQQCTKCGSELKLVIERRNRNMPSFSYDILECNNCGELNLFDREPGIGQFCYEGATIIEHVERKRYTKEQALARMDEIRQRGVR